MSDNGKTFLKNVELKKKHKIRNIQTATFQNKKEHLREVQNWQLQNY